MLGLRKRVSESKGTIKTFEYDGFAVSGEGEAKTLYAGTSINCDCRGGVLTTGVGVKKFLMNDGTNPDLPISGSVRAIYPIKQLAENGKAWEEKIGFVARNGMFGYYESDEGAYRMRFSLGKEVTPMRITDPNFKDTTMFIGPKGVLCCDINGQIIGLAITDNLMIGCVCKNRLFIGVKPYTIVYSSPQTPLIFTESTHGAGKIHLPVEKGNMVGIINFKETVYVFFDRGIMRLDACGLPYEFKAVDLAYGGGKIYPYSIGVCGDQVMFLATDGIYRFDGERLEKVRCLPVFPAEDNTEQWCCHASFEGMYLIRYLDQDGTFKIAVVYEDGKSGYFTDTFDAVHEGDGRAFCQYGLKIGMITRNGKLTSTSGYLFETADMDFGLLGRKTLRCLRFEGEGAMTVTVKTASGERTKRLEFSNGVAVWKVRERGEAFRFGIRLENGTRVRKMTAEIEYL